MKIFRLIIILLYMMEVGYCQVMKLIVNGTVANINGFPYVAYLSLKRLEPDKLIYYMCGSSILNQNLVLTAAHCVYGFNTGVLNITMFVGHEIKRRGLATIGISVAVHEEHEESTLFADICLVTTKTPFELNAKVNRVAIMKNPPYNEVGLIAGWGLIDIKKMSSTKSLWSMRQYYMPDHKECARLMNDSLANGSFCATSYSSSHLAKGDSGSALVVRSYIQIGIVSYRMKNSSETNENIGVYTDVGHYYEWIQNAANKLCTL